MSALAILAPAKVNLCLYLGESREADGRHALVTLFEALSLADELTVTAAETDAVICPGVEGQNLAAAALGLLREAGWAAPPLRVEIAKRIPVAAGMGGGSADAAAVLALALDSGIDVYALGRRLGADVPALIRPGLWLGTGAGEVVERYPAPGERAYVVVPADYGLSTAEVYREADRLGLARSATELAALEARLREGFSPELVVNDLGVAALSLAPGLAATLDALGDAGADQAIVSGSGPTAVGIWWGAGAAEAATAAASALSRRFPGALSALPHSTASQLRGTL